MVDFGRVVTAMVTPFQADGSVNYAVAEQLAAHLMARGSDALVICGTTGESPTLSWDEEYQLFQVVLQAVAGKALVIAGTGSNSTKEAIAATQKAAKMGVHGSLQVVPYYNKPPTFMTTSMPFCARIRGANSEPRYASRLYLALVANIATAGV